MFVEMLAAAAFETGRFNSLWTRRQNLADTVTCSLKPRLQPRITPRPAVLHLVTASEGFLKPLS